MPSTRGEARADQQDVVVGVDGRHDLCRGRHERAVSGDALESRGLAGGAVGPGPGALGGARAAAVDVAPEDDRPRERSTFEDPTPSVLDGQWHDAATKLDLAKAYQEMGDVEGAREILQEVLHEGDDQQKAEAKSLLGKLG